MLTAYKLYLSKGLDSEEFIYDINNSNLRVPDSIRAGTGDKFEQLYKYYKDKFDSDDTRMADEVVIAFAELIYYVMKYNVLYLKCDSVINEQHFDAIKKIVDEYTDSIYTIAKYIFPTKMNKVLPTVKKKLNKRVKKNNRKAKRKK